MNNRLSGPGTRRKNPSRYDQYARDHEMKVVNASTPQTKALRKLEDRRAAWDRSKADASQRSHKQGSSFSTRPGSMKG